MPDTATQIRDYYEEIVVRVTADEILEPAHALSPLPPRRFPGALVAGVAAALVLVGLGSAGLWFASAQPGVEPASPSTTQPPLDPPPVPNVLPDVGLADVPGFEAVVRYELGGRDGTPEGSTVEVLISYLPPDSFRREIVALDPADIEFWRGAVGDSVTTDGSFPINTGEITEEGELLGPLVWFNWESACSVVPVPVQTETTGRTLTTVACDDPDEPWTIVVDRESGIVLQADAELYGGDFAIPGIGFDVVSLTFEPDFAESWFATPEPEPPAIEGEPFVFTFSETLTSLEGLGSDTVVARVTWRDDGTWRLDVISGGLGSATTGSYLIFANQTLFTYTPDTNTFLEERFVALEGRRNLVAFGCETPDSCGPEDREANCVTSGERVAGRTVTRYDCEEPDGRGTSTEWFDDELGYLLKSVDGLDVFEVIEIDLDPVIDAAIFAQSCPTTNCTPGDTG